MPRRSPRKCGRPENLRPGDAIEVYWELDRVHYPCRVLSWNNETGLHKVRYDDDDVVEDIDLKKEPWRYRLNSESMGIGKEMGDEANENVSDGENVSEKEWLRDVYNGAIDIIDVSANYLSTVDGDSNHDGLRQRVTSILTSATKLKGLVSRVQSTMKGEKECRKELLESIVNVISNLLRVLANAAISNITKFDTTINKVQAVVEHLASASHYQDSVSGSDEDDTTTVVSRKSRLILCLTCLHWFLSEESQRVYNAVHGTSTADVKIGTSCIFASLKRVRAFDCYSSAVRQLRADTQYNHKAELQWFTEPSTRNLEKAKSNFSALPQAQWTVYCDALCIVAQALSETPSCESEISCSQPVKYATNLLMSVIKKYELTELG